MNRNIEVNQDVNHLRLLALFHYILAGLQAAFGCLPLVYAGFGVAFLSGAFENDRNPPPPEIGYLLLFLGIFGTLLLWGLAILKILAGRSLSQQKRYTFCFIMACIDCLNMPTGTILGVFTIIVLSRPSVKAMFAGEPMRDPRLDDFDRDDLPSAPPAAKSDGTFRNT